MNNLGFSMELDEINQLFPRAFQIIIYRVIQEILTNIGKHANAKALSITVRKEKNSVFFDIEDNGKGFDVEQVLATQDKGLGLMAMDERVKMLGGSLEIWSQKNLGTRLSFTIPTTK
jgi:signal transduction histidine kinase